MCGEQHHHLHIRHVVIGSPPRVRGTVPYSSGKSRTGGSPPRVRGTGSNYFFAALDAGITPACAGNRKSSGPQSLPLWDHPRVCGEQRHQTIPAGGAGGSPPRVRGTVDTRLVAKKPMGITPACAGNSLADRQRIEQV